MLTDEIEKYVSPAGVKVVASDMLPQSKLTKPALFICNTEEQTEKGAHWVVLGKPSEDLLIYFDALCVPPLAKYYYTFLSRNSEGVTFKTNKYPIQSDTSNHCGPFCVLLIWHLRTGRSFESFCAQFGASVAENDIKLEKLWNKFTRSSNR
jgi:hypothetical protein